MYRLTCGSHKITGCDTIPVYMFLYARHGQVCVGDASACHAGNWEAEQRVHKRVAGCEGGRTPSAGPDGILSAADVLHLWPHQRAAPGLCSADEG